MDKVEVVVVTFQQVTKGVCLYLNLCGRPRTSNEKSSFNNYVVTAVTKYFWEEKDMKLLNISVDGVSLDVEFVRYKLCKFLEVKSSHRVIIDPNHNFNNFRYQIIGGSGCAINGKCIINPDLLHISDVNNELWCINDYASYLLVLKLASYDVLSKICGEIEN